MFFRLSLVFLQSSNIAAPFCLVPYLVIANNGDDDDDGDFNILNFVTPNHELYYRHWPHNNRPTAPLLSVPPVRRCSRLPYQFVGLPVAEQLLRKINFKSLEGRRAGQSG